MKKWLYLISVGSMLAVFLFFYLTHLKEAEIRDPLRAEETAQQLKIEADRKADIEAKARADAEKRAADRAAEEKKKEADKLAKWEAEGQKIRDDTDGYNAKADEYSKQISNLEVELNALRTNKEKLNREAFEILKDVESAKIEKRTAELEIQRMTDMIAKRAADSSLTRPPVVVEPKS